MFCSMMYPKNVRKRRKSTFYDFLSAAQPTDQGEESVVLVVGGLLSSHLCTVQLKGGASRVHLLLGASRGHLLLFCHKK